LVNKWCQIISIMRILEKNAISVAAPSKAWICSHSLAGIADSNPAGRTDVCLLRVLCCQVEVSVMGRSLVQGSLTDCSASECDLETSIMRRSRPTRAFEQCTKKNKRKTLSKPTRYDTITGTLQISQ